MLRHIQLGSSDAVKWPEVSKDWFLVDTFINKRARLLQLLVFFSRQTGSDEIFIQLVQVNENPGNASKFLQRVPLSFFFTF